MLPIGQSLTTIMSKYNFSPRLHQVLIGETVDESGKILPLTLDLPKSVHVLNTGASGFGKSTLVEAVAIQLVGLPGVKIAAIDYGSGTFDMLEPCFGWQIADTPELARALLSELLEMCQARKELYKEIGRIKSLEQYNAKTGEDLPFVVLLVDETSALLEPEHGTREMFIELSRLGRKYGLGMFLSGTDFKATTLPSEARSNCQTRICFNTEAGLSRSLLNTDDASELGGQGEFVIKRPGVPGLVRGQAPLVIEGDYKNLAIEGNPKKLEGLPKDTKSNDQSGNARQVIELHEKGESQRAIEQAVFGSTGGSSYTRVKAILEKYATTTSPSDLGDL